MDQTSGNASTSWKDAARERIRPVILTLDRWGFSPTAVTIVGTVISVASGYLVAEGNLFWGTVVFLVGSAFDMLDGGLARLQGTVSRRGGFLDSCLDRFGEAAYLTGVAVYWMQSGHDDWQRAVILVLVTLFGSMATSYVRARAEGLGETCTVGFLQRTERVILLGIGGLLTHNVQFVVLWILAVLTLATTIQRIIHVAGKLPGPEPRSPMDAYQEPTVPEKLEPEPAPGDESPFDDSERTEIIEPAFDPDDDGPEVRP
jgi:CDP-diacylglycerol--glycerol-3-phosphate 3-phosphatidyltransferase